MIVRMWHGRVPTAKADAYRAFTNGRAIPDYRSVPGNISVHILERSEGDVTHFITLTFWESLDAIRAFAGDDVEKAMEESMMESIPLLQKRTHYLATFANLATLLGLLGTVSGLIHAFSAVATVNPAEKANLLSASISEAMNCTAFGLMTAVPILFVHALLQTKTTELIDGLETASVKFLNALANRAAAKVSHLGLAKAG